MPPSDDPARLLHDPIALVRSQALDALAAAGTDDVIVEALDDREPILRVKAVALLARHPAGLARALRHDDPDVREAAFACVRDPACPKRAQLLRLALGDRDPRRRRQALELIVGERLEGWCEALVRFPCALPVSDGELVAAVDDPHARALLQRRGAVEAVAAAAPKSRVALELLREMDPVRASMIAPGPHSPEERLRAWADDPEHAGEAARWLLRRGLWEALPASRWISHLREAAWEEWDLVQIVRKLGEGTDGTDALADAARGRHALVRRSAAAVLARRGAVDTLAETDDPYVLREVARALAERRDPRGLIPAVRAQRECRGMSGLLAAYPAAGTFGFAVEALRHRRGSVRLYGAERLEGTTDARAIPPLVALLSDASFEIQLAAVRALAQFAERPEVAEALLPLLEYGDLSVRQEAIEALGEGRSAAAVPALVRLLANPFLQRRAAQALKRIGDRKGCLAVLRRKRRDDQRRRLREAR